jgi:hypothetical protein
MSEKMIRRPKREPKLSDIILRKFKEKGGVYGVAKRKNLQGTNLYSQIKRCDTALLRIRKLLRLVDHDLEYKIVGQKSASVKT